LPLLALVLGVPFAHVGYAEFLGWSAAPTLSAMAVILWIKKQGLLRPANGKILSWEMVLFQLARWPWVVCAIIDAVKCSMTKTTLEWKITPKAQADKPASPVSMFIPYDYHRDRVVHFQPSLNTYIFATTNPEGTKIEDLMYFKFNGRFSESEKAALYKQNVDRGHVWDGDYRGFFSRFDWDGKREFKKLGLERYKHYIQYETNGVNAIVENMHEQDGKTSYQLRTLKQFLFEQTAIKQLIKEAKAKGTVTVGAILRVK